MRYSSLSPDELVKACAGSTNPALWEEFIRRFQPVIAAAVMRTAYRWGEPSRQTIDDLVQETYLKLCDDNSRLLRSFESRHPDAIFGYLKVLAGNVVHDHFKSTMADKRGGGQVDSFGDQAPGADSAAMADNSISMERHILLRQVDDALKLLVIGHDQDRNRMIFWLYYRDGLSANSIASLPYIGLTTKGVESILHRITGLIRGHLEGTDGSSRTGSE